MRTLGIIGGMGPLATHDFYRKVIERTPAADDPQHIAVVMVADTQIPLRIPAWEGRGPSPLPALIRAAQHCVNAGATVLAMPCNTAHFWFDEMVAALAPDVRFLHIAEEAVRALPSGQQTAPRVALCGTHVTVAMQLYPQAAQRLGLAVDWLLPDPPTQALITQAIAAVKGGNVPAAAQAFARAADTLAVQGAELLMLGCTELPVIAPHLSSPLPLLDATDALAQACVTVCMGG
jgi:aspartate racemase